MNLIKVRGAKKQYLEDYIQDFKDDMNSMLRNAFHDFGTMERTEESTGKRRITSWKPAVEIIEQNGNLVLKAEMPGIDKDNIDVEVTGDAIEIMAETKEEKEETTENIHRSELRYGKFQRYVPLPAEVDYTRAKAEYKSGMLKVTVPKLHVEEKKLNKLKPE